MPYACCSAFHSTELVACRLYRLLAVPPVAVLQGWQMSIGVDLAVKTWAAVVNPEGWLEQEHRESDLRGMRGTFFSGCIFSFLGVMNCYNTVVTITEKRRSDQAVKQRRTV